MSRDRTEFYLAEENVLTVTTVPVMDLTTSYPMDAEDSSSAHKATGSWL
jgi:hypothetical protein